MGFLDVPVKLLAAVAIAKSKIVSIATEAASPPLSFGSGAV
jgi:hypothetical protein